MLAGFILAVAGFASYFLFNTTLGIILMIAGIAVIIVTATISGVFYKISMIEYMEERRKNRK